MRAGCFHVCMSRWHSRWHFSFFCTECLTSDGTGGLFIDGTAVDISQYYYNCGPRYVLGTSELNGTWFGCCYCIVLRHLSWMDRDSFVVVLRHRTYLRYVGCILWYYTCNTQHAQHATRSFILSRSMCDVRDRVRFMVQKWLVSTYRKSTLYHICSKWFSMAVSPGKYSFPYLRHYMQTLGMCIRSMCDVRDQVRFMVQKWLVSTYRKSIL